jgi:bacterioferritin (cytochrome b1)
MADSTTDKSMMYRLIKERGANQLDDLTTGLVNAMKYSDPKVLYPNGEAEAGNGVQAEWFLPAYKGTNGFSEMNAIIQYISQESLWEDIGEMMMGIAMVEMKHLDKLGDLIIDLGGDITSQKYETTFVEYGKSTEDAVRLGIKAEKETIEEYNKIIDKIKPLPQNETTEFCLALLAKLIADEQFHVNLFEAWLKENGK